MTTIAPPLDTGGGAIFPYTGRNTRRGAERTVRAVNLEWRDGKRDGPNMRSICKSPDSVAI